MSDGQVTTITTKKVTEARIKPDHILVIGAEDGPGGLQASVAATVSASHNPGVDAAYDRAEREYDPAAYDNGTVIARIQPDGTIEWPQEENDE